jgi:uncharacterized protein (DUF1810 family)
LKQLRLGIGQTQNNEPHNARIKYAQFKMNKEYKLERFIEAQKDDYQIALSEIKQGRKRSHWMWYIFPQIQGLSISNTSKFYAIRDLTEAEAFLQHPVLGSRLIAICSELLKLTGNDAHAIFGSPDDSKLKSSMTLFSSLENSNPVFKLVLDKFYNGIKDHHTLAIIDRV